MLLIFLLREVLVVVLVVVIFNHIVVLLWLSGHVPPMQFPNSEANDRCSHRKYRDKKTYVNH